MTLAPLSAAHRAPATAPDTDPVPLLLVTMTSRNFPPRGRQHAATRQPCSAVISSAPGGSVEKTCPGDHGDAEVVPHDLVVPASRMAMRTSRPWNWSTRGKSARMKRIDDAAGVMTRQKWCGSPIELDVAAVRGGPELFGLVVGELHRVSGVHPDRENLVIVRSVGPDQVEVPAGVVIGDDGVATSRSAKAIFWTPTLYRRRTCGSDIAFSSIRIRVRRRCDRSGRESPSGRTAG
jgi:hypothetical protein